MGGNAFWNFRSQGGVKTWKPSVVGYGYFLELPNIICSQTKLDDSAHEKTITSICRHLFAAHMVSSQPMKRKKNSLILFQYN